MKRLAIIAILVVGVGAFVVLRRGGPSAGAAVAPPAVPVTVGHAQYQDLPVWLDAVGTVQSVDVVDVKVRVDGQLQRVAFAEGSDVRRGELLAQLDPRPFQAQLELAVANVAKDQAQLVNAKANLDRFEKLASLGAAPTQNVDTFKAQVAQLDAAIQGDRAMIDTARLNLDFTSVRSPLDGRVGIQRVDPGAIVHASDPNGLVTVTQMDPIEVVFSLPQDVLPGLLAAPGKLKVAAYTRTNAQRLGEGELSVVDNQIDPTTGQIRLKARFVNAQRTLWPGELVAVRILVRTDRHALVVPSQAVLGGQAGPYVYAVQADGTVAVRPVKIAASVDGMASIASGLSTTDTVVVAGQSRIASGTRVVASGGAS
jgi:multidrug efflux system membrane fusion protein